MGTHLLNKENINVAVIEGDEFVTKAVSVIQTDHKYIHYGKAFHSEIQTPSIAAGSSYYIRFKTPANVFVHKRPAAFSSSENIMKYDFFEESTVTANGSSLIPNNRNRLSANDSSVIIGLGASVSSDGLLLESFTVGSGGGTQNRSGGSISGDADEWVLKQNTEYVIKISNIGSSTASIGYLGLFWYEEGSGGSDGY